MLSSLDICYLELWLLLCGPEHGWFLFKVCLGRKIYFLSFCIVLCICFICNYFMCTFISHGLTRFYFWNVDISNYVAFPLIFPVHGFLLYNIRGFRWLSHFFYCFCHAIYFLMKRNSNWSLFLKGAGLRFDPKENATDVLYKEKSSCAHPFHPSLTTALGKLLTYFPSKPRLPLCYLAESQLGLIEDNLAITLCS